MHHSLILLDVKKKYSGAYTCIATNKAGQSVCTATLEVADGKSLLQSEHILCVMFYTVTKRKTSMTAKEINQITAEKKMHCPNISHDFACFANEHTSTMF